MKMRHLRKEMVQEGRRKAHLYEKEKGNIQMSIDYMSKRKGIQRIWRNPEEIQSNPQEIWRNP